MFKRNYNLLAGLLLIIGGTSLLITIARTPNSIVIAAPVVSSSVQPPVAEPSTITGSPVKLDVPSLSLSLPVILGQYNYISRQWTLTDDKVQYANLTPLPNDKEGNTLIYGHARKGVFASLPQIKVGDKAVVTTDNGHVFTYKLISSQIVQPEDSGVILGYEGKPVLTLQTCTGLFSQNRQLFLFELEGAV